MPPKAKTPAPIDRPLSRAYLREFTGWSTEYPPGISEPTSLRIMENVAINRDGSARVRPGLRYLSYRAGGLALDKHAIGTHEAFYLNDGSKAYLFAVRENDGTVGFRVLTFPSVGTPVVKNLSDAGIGFAVEGSSPLNFSSATTYVKYLQIDNKIFALSNAGERMRMFYVGASKKAKTLEAITRPNWTAADKLTVVHPQADWVYGGIDSYRYNLAKNPSFEEGTSGWEPNSVTKISTTTAMTPKSGSKTLKIESLASRTNLCPSPLHACSVYGTAGWYNYSASTVNTFMGGDQVWVTLSSPGTGLMESGSFPVTGGQEYQLAVDASVGDNTYATAVGRVAWFNIVGATISTSSFTLTSSESETRPSVSVTAPAGAMAAVIRLGVTHTSPSGGLAMFRNVVFCKSGEGTSAFSGSSGSYYYWSSTVNASSSIYHPPTTVTVATEVDVNDSNDVCMSGYLRSTTAGRTAGLTSIMYHDDTVLALDIYDVEHATVTVGAWARIFRVDTDLPATTNKIRYTFSINNVARGEVHYLDAAMAELGVSTPGAYFDGDTTDSGSTVYGWTGTPHASTSMVAVYGVSETPPDPATRTADTLRSTPGSNNTYRVGLFYTFNNEVGESAASQVAVVNVQRPWSGWLWETPNAAAEPSGEDTADATRVADQLVAILPPDVYAMAQEQGATSWNLYACTWSNQDSVPVTALKAGTKSFDANDDFELKGWIQMTPQTTDMVDTTVLPTVGNRYNYSDPSRGGQGIVAADRLVMVYDPVSQAVVRWTSNQQGEYTNFTANKGGGYKTLTSGNLYIPACVKLWQNPQSVDTLTVLCQGTDGHSTSYYMAPAQVAAQAEAVNIMGFEETTATPGTTSPYGCEVFNNALYHPLDDELMKSTAMNYNINHKTQTDPIAKSWSMLENKHRIVSSQLSGYLYYIVHNPMGEELEYGCHGNEIWVLDAGAKTATWSRWLIQAQSLRKVELYGKTYMSVIRPDGIFYLDPEYGFDDKIDYSFHVTPHAISWKLETNTQGANRAHDAWAHLQQVNINLGNFHGEMRYGIRAWDIHGQPIDINKVVRDENTPSELTFDLEDSLQIRRDLKEWFFYAESVNSGVDAVLPCFGQINVVQYRYTPSTVNTGYELGSVETFEYGRAAAGAAGVTTNGIPDPLIDVRRP